MSNEHSVRSQVSALGLGCMGMSQSDGCSRTVVTPSPRTAPQSSVGSRSETAQVDGPFTNEELVGEALRPVATRW